MKRSYRTLLLILVVLAAGALIYCLCSVPPGPSESTEKLKLIPRLPGMSPDYCGVVIPANIAPMNFLIEERAVQYCVRINGHQGDQIEVNSKSAGIVIPKSPWRRLLEANRGKQINIDILVKNSSGDWSRYKTVTNAVAAEDIDGYLVYRRIHPGCNAWKEIGVYQRDLAGFDESLVLDNSYFSQGCLNCHAFCNNKTDKMLLGIRSSQYGSSALLECDGKAQKIGAKFGYTTWHPSGRLAAYSINQVNQFFHTSQPEVRDVLDLNSLLAYYSLDTKTVKTIPAISKKDRLETYPAWSADGKYLYFCSAPITWETYNIIPVDYNDIKYDLMRISYDIETDKWGKLETVLAAKDTGLSILLPRISPDGRWLIFCMCDYGCFPVYRASSDLFIVDLDAVNPGDRPACRRLDINSDQSESWHSFSSNSRWIAFSSKKGSAPFTRSYLAYVDTEGKVHKAFVLPQKDPAHYDSCLTTYSVPELVTEPVRVVKEKLGRVVRGPVDIAVDMPVTMATPKAGSAEKKPWYTERE
ncbi:MAG: PD40 domain-containing protein [Sedimentisphaerales bacterium]|nr:PD40 domain-containing protein [Sedimentisphaerales bacterium]